MFCIHISYLISHIILIICNLPSSQSHHHPSPISHHLHHALTSSSPPPSHTMTNIHEPRYQKTSKTPKTHQKNIKNPSKHQATFKNYQAERHMRPVPQAPLILLTPASGISASLQLPETTYFTQPIARSHSLAYFLSNSHARALSLFVSLSVPLCLSVSLSLAFSFSYYATRYPSQCPQHRQTSAQVLAVQCGGQPARPGPTRRMNHPNHPYTRLAQPPHHCQNLPLVSCSRDEPRRRC